MACPNCGADDAELTVIEGATNYYDGFVEKEPNGSLFVSVGKLHNPEVGALTLICMSCYLELDLLADDIQVEWNQ